MLVNIKKVLRMIHLSPFMIMWKKVMVWFVGTRPGKVKIVEEPAVYRSGMWVLLQ